MYLFCLLLFYVEFVYLCSLNAKGIAQLVATIQQYQPLFADRPDYSNLTTTADQELTYQPEHREFIYST